MYILYTNRLGKELQYSCRHGNHTRVAQLSAVLTLGRPLAPSLPAPWGRRNTWPCLGCSRTACGWNRLWPSTPTHEHTESTETTAFHFNIPHTSRLKFSKMRKVLSFPLSDTNKHFYLDIRGFSGITKNSHFCRYLLVQLVPQQFQGYHWKKQNDLGSCAPTFGTHYSVTNSGNQ